MVVATAPWLAYGEVVLDHLVGRRRASVAQVLSTGGTPPHPATVRSALGLPSDVAVAVTETPPRPVCSLDHVVMLSNGDLARHHGLARPLPTTAGREIEPVTAGQVELAVDLTTFDLGVEDILRLARVRDLYPEVGFGEPLRGFLASALAFFDALAPSFDELAILIDLYAVTP